VVDADPGADPPWMVTAFIHGPSLQQAVAEGGPFSLEQLCRLGAGLAEGLAAIHACGLVHRDLKPSNVILAQDGPRIIDFGIARAAEASPITTAGMVVGTYSYMSPEQLLGGVAGPASDVFALGCTLAYAATARVTFGDDSIVTVVYRITSEPPDLTDVTEEHGFRQLLSECLAKNPADRPSLATILARLGTILERLAGMAEPATNIRRSAEPVPDTPALAAPKPVPDVAAAPAAAESSRMAAAGPPPYPYAAAAQPPPYAAAGPPPYRYPPAAQPPPHPYPAAESASGQAGYPSGGGVGLESGRADEPLSPEQLYGPTRTMRTGDQPTPGQAPDQQRTGPDGIMRDQLPPWQTGQLGGPGGSGRGFGRGPRRTVLIVVAVAVVVIGVVVGVLLSGG